MKRRNGKSTILETKARDLILLKRNAGIVFVRKNEGKH